MVKNKKDPQFNPIIHLKTKFTPLNKGRFSPLRQFKNLIKTPRDHFLKSYLEPTQKLAFPLLLMVLIVLISSGRLWPKTDFQRAKEELITDPQNIQARLLLAETFLKNNQTLKAEQELLTVKKISELNPEKKRVLGVQSGTQFEALWQTKNQQNPKDLHRLINYWESFLETNPLYRDGYLHLSLLYYQTNQPAMARETIQKALDLDPNHEITKQVEHIIK